MTEAYCYNSEKYFFLTIISNTTTTTVTTFGDDDEESDGYRFDSCCYMHSLSCYS